MSGCDYTDGIFGYGPKKALDLVKNKSEVFKQLPFFKNTIQQVKIFLNEVHPYLHFKPLPKIDALYNWLVNEPIIGL